MITAAAWASTSMSDLSRLVRSLSEVSPAAQNVPYRLPSLRTTGTETYERIRGRRAAGSFMASGKSRRSGMTAGSFLSRIAWHSVVACRCWSPSLKRNGTEDSTTSRCWVVPSSRLRKATLRRSESFAVRSRSATCSSASERSLATRPPHARSAGSAATAAAARRALRPQGSLLYRRVRAWTSL